MSDLCRKFLILFISLLFIFSLPIPAFATDGDTTEYRAEDDVADAVSERPENGEVLYSKHKRKPSSLRYENKTDYDCVVYLINSSGAEVLKFYVYSNSRATVAVPTGEFTIATIYGKTWKNEDELFGDNFEYYDEDMKFEITKDKSWALEFKEAGDWEPPERWDDF